MIRKTMLALMAGLALTLAGCGATDDPAPAPTPEATTEAPQEATQESTTDAPTPTPTTPTPEPTPEPTTEAPAPAPVAPDDPLTDGDWTASQVTLDTSNPFITTMTARITNNSDGDKTGAMFTITVLGADGSVLGTATGAANEVGAGETQTVELLADDTLAEVDTTGAIFELQVDADF